MEASASGAVAGRGGSEAPGVPSLWTRAVEVRAAVAQELARRGWSAAVDLVGTTTANPQLELVLQGGGPEDRRRWTVAVTEAPVSTQVRRLLVDLDELQPQVPARLPTVANRWCAPA